MSNVAVHSIEALDHLRADLIRYQDQVQHALQAMALEADRTLQWLQDRVWYWKKELDRRFLVQREAERALSACMQRDREGRVPPCTAQKQAVDAAKAAVKQAEHEYVTASQLLEQTRKAYQQYTHRANRLRALTDTALPKATSRLQRQADILRAQNGMAVGDLAATVALAGVGLAAVGIGTVVAGLLKPADDLAALPPQAGDQLPNGVAVAQSAMPSSPPTSRTVEELQQRVAALAAEKAQQEAEALAVLNRAQPLPIPAPDGSTQLSAQLPNTALAYPAGGTLREQASDSGQQEHEGALEGGLPQEGTFNPYRRR